MINKFIVKWPVMQVRTQKEYLHSILHNNNIVINCLVSILYFDIANIPNIIPNQIPQCLIKYLNLSEEKTYKYNRPFHAKYWFQHHSNIVFNAILRLKHAK